jgi:hypothetical protein
MRTGVAFVFTIGVLGALAVWQPAAPGRAASVSHPRRSTVETVAGPVLAFAQDQRYLAWLLPGPTGDYGLGHVGVVVVQDLWTGRRTRVPARPSSADLVTCEDPSGLALSGDRAYWEQRCGTQNIYYAVLASSAVRDRRLRGLGEENAEIASDDQLQPPVGDGANAYFWSVSEDAFSGPIVRFDGLRRHNVSGRLADVSALAAGGGGVAWATYDRDEASAPAFSPDGKEIAYVRRDRELWLVNADGSDQHQLTAPGRDPDWSPDGTKLAYGGLHNQVLIANADGSDATVVTRGSDPAWSPDGSELAVVDQGGIWVVSTDGHDRRRVIADGVAPDWAPDGKRLVFARGEYADQVWIANADGTALRRLVADGGEPASPAWSPDGTEIAFTGYDACDPYGDYPTICTIHPNGRDLQDAGTGADELHSTEEPAWGPQPGELAYARYGPNGDDPGPHIALLSNNETQTITSAPGLMPVRVNRENGRYRVRFASGGTVLALAVSGRVAAALVGQTDGSAAVEIYEPLRHIVPLATEPQRELAATRTTLFFQLGNRIVALDALHGTPHPIAATHGPAIGLSIVGRRLAWAENSRAGTIIHTLQLR